VTVQASAGSDTDTSRPDFGANEWLVEEMYERYLIDPNTVDAAWHEFFDDYRPKQADPKPTPSAKPAQPAQAQPAQAQAIAASITELTPTGTAPTEPAARPSDSAATVGKKSDWTTPSVAPIAAAETHATTLRGAPAKVVSNMQASLEVPTATSVRAVPAKLIADNRIVINNHLQRARGGKVSFTHLIGYAVVRALDSFGEMNNSFAITADGKPALLRPEHVNFGL
jgi:2-oxoglutarate decarboxylase